MQLAFIYPSGDKGGQPSQIYEGLDGKDLRNMQDRIYKARKILRHSRELAEEVLSGVTKLDSFLGVEAQKQAGLLDAPEKRGLRAF